MVTGVPSASAARAASTAQFLMLPPAASTAPGHPGPRRPPAAPDRATTRRQIRSRSATAGKGNSTITCSRRAKAVVEVGDRRVATGDQVAELGELRLHSFADGEVDALWLGPLQDTIQLLLDVDFGVKEESDDRDSRRKPRERRTPGSGDGSSLRRSRRRARRGAR
jgi:hypothetical protein